MIMHSKAIFGGLREGPVNSEIDEAVKKLQGINMI
jgi:hypothetical protein